MERSCCARGYALDSQQWAMVHFGGAALGDARRGRRLVHIAQALAENPHMSLPKQFADWTDLIGAYRFFSNPQVDPQAIVQPHKDLVRQEAAGHPVVLCVQDDALLDFSYRIGMKGLGRIGDGHGRGLLQHGSLAVLPDKRVLGLLDIDWKAPVKPPPHETRQQRQARWTPYDLWQEAALRVGPWPERSTLIHVGDRHADLFRFLDTALCLGHGFVVRAMFDRYIDNDTTHVWEKLEAQDPLGRKELGLSPRANRHQIGRKATLTIRSAPIEVPPPRHDPRNKAVLSLWAVYVKEEHPPAGVEAIEWMLITSVPADTLEQALLVIDYYTCRWVIEEWHRCLKEGCRIEQGQFDDGADVQRLGAIQAVLAVRLLQMRDLAEDPQTADSPGALRVRVPEIYIRMVAGLARRPPDRLTPAQFWQAIAKRGGYLARKHDPRPGWIVMWRGWSDVVQMVRGAEMYKQMSKRGNRSV